MNKRKLSVKNIAVIFAIMTFVTLCVAGKVVDNQKKYDLTSITAVEATPRDILMDGAKEVLKEPPKTLNERLPGRVINCFNPEDSVTNYVYEISTMYNLDPYILLAMIEVESNFNTKAYSNGCCGLMQVNPKWHADRMRRLGVDDILDPYSNILVGADYLSELINEYGDISSALMFYNMKHATARRLVDNGIVSKYASYILERANEIREEETNETNCSV